VFRGIACRLFVALHGLAAGAAVEGDINNDDKIDLVESIYALRMVSQSTGAERPVVVMKIL